MKTLYIHIGTPKTATTSIQHFLDKNRDALYEEGFIFRPVPIDFHLHGDRGNPTDRNGFFLHGVGENNPYFNQEQRIRDLQTGLDLVARWFEEKDNVILTDEIIWNRLGSWDFPERLKVFTDSRGIRVRFIAYLRPEYSLMDSWYRERVKAGDVDKPWDASYKHYLDFADYEGNLHILSDLFGKEAVIVRRFEPGVWKKEGRTVYLDFTEALGITLSDHYKLPKANANESLTHNYTEIRRVLNHLESKGPTPKSIFFRKAALHCSQISAEEDRFTFFNEEQAAWLKETTKEGNRRVALDYLGTEELFADRPLPPAWDPKASGYLNDVVLYYSYIAYEQQQLIETLKKHTFFYRVHVLFQKIKNRFRRSKK